MSSFQLQLTLRVPFSHLFKWVVFCICVRSCYPRVLQELVWWHSLFGFLHKKSPYNILGIFRYFRPCRCVEIIFNLLNFLKESKVVFIEKGRAPAQQDEKNNSNAPVVTRHMIWFLFKNFWCHISWGTACSRCKDIILNKSSQAEVWNLERSFGDVFCREKEVFRFNVTMNDSLRVTISYSIHYRRNQLLGFLLWEAGLFQNLLKQLFIFHSQTH